MHDVYSRTHIDASSGIHKNVVKWPIAAVILFFFFTFRFDHMRRQTTRKLW